MAMPLNRPCGCQFWGDGSKHVPSMAEDVVGTWSGIIEYFFFCRPQVGLKSSKWLSIKKYMFYCESELVLSSVEMS